MQGLHCIRKLYTDERGAALTEGLILLPLLTLVFGALVYMGVRYSVLLVNGRQVRQQVWQNVITGCPGMSPPSDVALLGHLGLFRPMANTWVPLRAPFIDDVVTGSVRVEKQSAINRPSILAGGQRQLNSQLMSDCNVNTSETESGLDAVITDTYCRTGACL